LLLEAAAAAADAEDAAGGADLTLASFLLLEAGADELNLVFSASDSHNLANVRMTSTDSLRAFEEIFALGQAWSTAAQRERERELAFRGGEIAQALLRRNAYALAMTKRVLNKPALAAFNSVHDAGLAYPPRLCAAPPLARGQCGGQRAAACLGWMPWPLI
jgi:hypothetical protein